MDMKSKIHGLEGESMSLYYKVDMEKLPENCNECTFHFCRLPLKNNKYEPELKKEYMTKRHKECPLKEIEEGN